MRSTRIVRLGALGVMLGAFPASPLGAQSAAAADQIARPALETFYTQIRYAGDQGRLHADGVGARLMWRGPSLWDARNALADRLDLGLFGAFTPKHTLESDLSATTYHVGLAADLRAFDAPLAGRFDPFASLGAGVLSTRVPGGPHRTPSPMFKDSQSSFTLAPGVGARVLVASFLGVQGDVRDVMTFTGGTRHNPTLSAGLRVTF